MNLVEELDPTVRFAEIGLAGESALSQSQDALWSGVGALPGADLVSGVDVDEAVALSVDLPDLDAVGETASSAFDAYSEPVLDELQGTMGQATSTAAGAQQALVEEGWRVIQDGQAEALDFGQSSVDAVKDGLVDTQGIAHAGLTDAVDGGRQGIHALWDEASGTAGGMLEAAESEANSIREHFESLIDDLPSIPFIGRVIDRLIDEMMDEVLGMFDDVQGGITDAFDAVWAEAVARVDDVRSLAEEGFVAFEEHVVDEVGTFATQTLPQVVGDVAELSEDVASDVAVGASEIGEDLVDAVEAAAEETADAFDDGVDLLEDGVDGGVKLGEEAAAGAGQLGGAALDGAGGLTQDVLDAAEHIGAGAIDGVTDLGEQLATWAKEGISEVEIFLEVVQSALASDELGLVYFLLKAFAQKCGPAATFGRLADLAGISEEMALVKWPMLAAEHGLLTVMDATAEVYGIDTSIGASSRDAETPTPTTATGEFTAS